MHALIAGVLLFVIAALALGRAAGRVDCDGEREHDWEDGLLASIFFTCALVAMALWTVVSI